MGDYHRDYRLADVIRLVQALGLGPEVTKYEKTLQKEFDGPPKSKLEGWVPLAAEHPEFFRANQKVQDPADHSTHLVARFLQGDQRRPPLSDDRIHSLVALAIDLHERQARSSEVHSVLERLERETRLNSSKVTMTFIVAMIGALGSIFAAVIGLWARK